MIVLGFGPSELARVSQMRVAADDLRNERDDLLAAIEGLAREMKALPLYRRAGVLVQLSLKTARLNAVIRDIEATGQ